MNWKKLSCTALTALGMTACNGWTGAEIYDGRITATAIYAESSKAFSRNDVALLNGNEQDLELSFNPDICEITGARNAQGQLQLNAGARCAVHSNLAPREGTFVAVITEQSVIEAGAALAVQLRGTIHEGTADAPSEGELVLSFQGERSTTP